MERFEFDEHGLVPPTHEELLKADEEAFILVYMTGMTADGRPYYAYLSIKPSRYEAFQTKKRAKQQIIPEDYGSILASGFDSSPPPEVIDLMRRTHGFDEQYMDRLQAGMIAEYIVFLKKSETKRIEDIVAMLKKKPTAK